MKRPTVDYGKWIADALARNPNLSRAGLSRHLGHGSDRARVIKIIDGSRKITAQEVLEIAAYLGVPPPQQPGLTSRLPIKGAVDPGIWLEEGVMRVGDAVQVPPRPDLPAEDQGAYEMTVASPKFGLIKGDYLITIPKTTLTGLPDTAVLVAARTRADLRQYVLAYVEPRRNGLELRPAIDTDQTDELSPVALVVGMYRKFG